MPDWVGDMTVAQLVGAVIVLAGVGWLIRKVWPVARKLARFLDQWAGVDVPGMPRIPGIVERLSTIEYQLHPNSGGSLRDQVDAVRSAQRATNDKVDAVCSAQRATNDKVDALGQKLTDHIARSEP